jgi:hypothetical protein
MVVEMKHSSCISNIDNKLQNKIIYILILYKVFLLKY